METFFNLIWLAVTATLCTLWLINRPRFRRGRPSLPGIGVQLVALALLVLILLPVISLTDDLQACTAPAETEHLARRGDLQMAAEQTPHAVTVALAALFALPQRAQTREFASLLADEPLPPGSQSHAPSLAKRPPPAA